MANPGPASTGATNTQTPYANLQLVEVLSITMSPGILAPNTGATGAIEQSFGVNGTVTTAATSILAKDVIISVSKPASQANIGIVGWRNDQTTNDKFYVTFLNSTNVTVTPTASEVYLVTVGRQNLAAAGITAVV